jgi:hypothetical protein
MVFSKSFSALEKSQYIEVKKEFVAKSQKHLTQVTPFGRAAFKEHLSYLEN